MIKQIQCLRALHHWAAAGALTQMLERMLRSGLIECSVRGIVEPKIPANTMAHRALVEIPLLAVF